MTPAALVLADAERRLIERAQELASRLDDGDSAAWVDFIPVVTALHALIPEERRPMLNTQDMADRLGVTLKTIRRWGKLGQLEHERHGARGRGAIRWRA